MKICIIGAGIAGLSAAYNLSKNGHEVSIYESSPFAGGQASTIKINDFEIEKAYHHLFVTDKAILNLYKELGMSKDLKWYKSSVATYSEGKVWKTTSPFDLLLLSLIPFKERIKLILLSLRLKLLRNWKKMKSSLLEEAEKLEQLRLLENGCSFKTFAVACDSFSVDTFEQLEEARELSKKLNKNT